MRSISNSASVIKKVYVPKYIYPLANVGSNFFTFLISLLVLVSFDVIMLGRLPGGQLFALALANVAVLRVRK